MPCDTGTEDIAVGGVVRHGEITDVLFHEQVVDMLVLRKEAQTDGPNVKIGIHVHPGVVAYLGVLLGGEHAGGRAEDGRVILREIAQVDAYLCIEGFEPRAVVIEPVLQDDEGHRQHAVVGAMLEHGAVLEVDPRGGQVEADIAGDDLYVAVVLTRFPIGRGDIDGVGLVLKTEVDPRLKPLVGIGDGGSAEEAIGETEVIIPPDMVGAVGLQVVVGRLALGVGACVDGERVSAGVELRSEFTVHIELADLVAEDAHFAFDMIVHVRAAMLVNGSADEGVVGPAVVVDAIRIVGHAVVEEALALVHREGRDTEAELGVVRFAEGDGEGIADREHVRRVIGVAGVVIGGVVEMLVRVFLDVPPVRVIGLEDMTESHKGYMLHLDRIAFDASSVFDHFDRVVVLALAGDGILVVEVAAEVAIPDHGVEPHGYIFGVEATAEQADVLQTTVVERIE